MVRFAEIFLSFYHLNISRPDIPCVFENGVGGATKSTQPVTLYITVNIKPSNLYNSPPDIPAKDDVSLAEEATIPEHIQPPAPEHLLRLSHHKSIETRNTVPQSREEMFPTITKNPRFALNLADKVMGRIVPVGRSDTRESALGRIKWVMDTLSPIEEVRVIPFEVLGGANFQTQLFPLSKMAHDLLSAIPQARLFVSFSERDAHATFVWIVDAPRTVPK